MEECKPLIHHWQSLPSQRKNSEIILKTPIYQENDPVVKYTCQQNW